MSFSMNSFQHIDSAFPVIKETVPASALGYNTNNKYPEFPPLMSDGRSITASWQPEAVMNADLKQRNGIESNWQYRQFLTQNAKPIMEYNFRNSSNDIGYYVRHEDLPNIQSGNIVDFVSNMPYLYNSPMDTNKPLGYSDTDLKQLYLSREELESRKIAPVIGP
jgi:hypothetical protein